MDAELIPRWQWRLVLLALFGAVALVLILLVLALIGVSNPRHIGTLAIRDDLDTDAGWKLRPADGASGEIEDGVYRVALPRGQEHAFVQSPYQASAPCSLMISARQIEGPTDAGYGLWWGDLSAGRYGVAAVNGDGYITVFEAIDGNVRAIKEWQVFPRIHPQNEANTLQADIADGQVLVRVNDEIVITFDWMPGQSIQTGFYVETVSGGGTVSDLDWLAIWEED